jgi:hypothetical protein
VSLERLALYAGGAVATAAGLHTVIAGARSVPGGPAASPELDSELRYYSAFYVAYGVAALRTAPRADEDPAAVRALAGALFVAGLARAGSWLATGRPHPVQRMLLALELGVPAVVLAASARRQAGAPSDELQSASTPLP